MRHNYFRPQKWGGKKGFRDPEINFLNLLKFKSLKQNKTLRLVCGPYEYMDGELLIGLFGFYGISTFVGYLILNLFLYK